MFCWELGQIEIWRADSEVVSVATSRRMLARIDSYKISTVYRPDAVLLPWVSPYFFRCVSVWSWHNFRWWIYFFRHPSRDAVISATVLNHKLQATKKKSRKRKDSEDSDSDGAEAIKHVSEKRVECISFFFFQFWCRFQWWIGFCVETEITMSFAHGVHDEQHHSWRALFRRRQPSLDWKVHPNVENIIAIH